MIRKLIGKLPPPLSTILSILLINAIIIAVDLLIEWNLEISIILATILSATALIHLIKFFSENIEKEPISLAELILYFLGIGSFIWIISILSSLPILIVTLFVFVIFLIMNIDFLFKKNKGPIVVFRKRR